jgi:hypothetical protein
MTDKKDEFHGNGRVSGAMGKASAYSIAAIAGGGVLLQGLSMAPDSKVKTVATMAVIAGTSIAPLVGLVRGWQKADTAIKDQAALVQERDMYKNAVTNAVHEGTVTVSPSLNMQRA